MIFLIVLILFVGFLFSLFWKLAKTKKAPVPSVPVVPVEPDVPDEESLTRYLSRLFPTKSWDKVPGSQKRDIYMGLDAWYTEMLPGYEQLIIARQPRWNDDRMKLWNHDVGVWEKLFDGSLCDCMRFAFPNCTMPDSRFGGRDILKQCPNWPGLNVGKTQETVLIQAYNTNNTDFNFIPSGKGGKGFPNYSWFEGLAYPGEYGHPVVCGKIPASLRESQPGVEYKDNETGEWKPLEKPFSSGPWYNSKCQKGECPFDFLECVEVKSDGQFPEGDKIRGKFCISSSDKKHREREAESSRSAKMQEFFDAESAVPFSQELKEEEEEKGEGGEEETETRLRAFENCDHFPKVPCRDPPNDGFHGLWLYPLRGVGMWRNIGNSVVCSTKLGYLITPAKPINGGNTPLGAGYSLENMLKLAGTHGGGAQNINLQLTRLTQIIQYGQVRKTRSYPAMSVRDLQKHGYKGGRVRSRYGARSAALELMKKWYMEGYSGVGSSRAPNGFNYNYTRHFPLGCHFGYAAGFDNLVVGTMVKDKVDTLQLTAEPQATKAGLVPAYLFEIFQVTPGKKTSDASWCTFKDKNPNQCKDFFMVDPTADLDNYLKYGYVSGSAVKNPPVFDPKQMTLSAVKPVFSLKK